ncbi:MAG: hypothetical protein AAFU49_20785 [Pseudomonadota bacterium]
MNTLNHMTIHSIFFDPISTPGSHPEAGLGAFSLFCFGACCVHLSLLGRSTADAGRAALSVVENGDLFEESGLLLAA